MRACRCRPGGSARPGPDRSQLGQRHSWDLLNPGAGGGHHWRSSTAPRRCWPPSRLVAGADREGRRSSRTSGPPSSRSICSLRTSSPTCCSSVTVSLSRRTRSLGTVRFSTTGCSSCSTTCFLLAPCPFRHAGTRPRRAGHGIIPRLTTAPSGQTGASTAVAPPTAPAAWLRARGLLAGLVADLLGVLLGTFGQVLPVLLAALPSGLGGAAGRLLGDLLAALQGLLPGLLGLVFDLVGHRTQPLVLDPGRRHGQAGQEADRGGPDGQPERVLLGQTSGPPGLLLDLPTAGRGLTHPRGGPTGCVAGAGGGSSHRLLGPPGRLPDSRLGGVRLVGHRLSGPGGHVGLVLGGVHGLAHLGPGLG